MRAFIVRPFGVKKGIDFDVVEAKLIRPALAALNIEGGPTGDILEAGNIRLDMFERLVTADVVVADISIQNPNVYYELGIRHSMQERVTFMIRAGGVELQPDEVPFDLKTDRYMTYSPQNPGASVARLTEGLQQSIAKGSADSPVFQNLPGLQAQDRSHFLMVPISLREEIERAARQGSRAQLALLAVETRGFLFEREAFRLIGRAQLGLKDYANAKVSWESIRDIDPFDIEANLKLGTVYQRLDRLADSDLALQRVLQNASLSEEDRAEAHALLGSNQKTLWWRSWRDKPVEEARLEALQSPHLGSAYEEYSLAYEQQLDHYYSGLNALFLLTVMLELAAALSDEWSLLFDTAEEARLNLKKLSERRTAISGALSLAIDASRQSEKRSGVKDTWLAVTEAEYCCLNSKRPREVAMRYQQAKDGIPKFSYDSMRFHLNILDRLGILADNGKAALSVVPEIPAEPKPDRVVVFTGHMIDAPDRKPPRFPAGKESVAREAIRKAMEEERSVVAGTILGMSGGSNGGDILFHEVCVGLGVPTQLFLALPEDQYAVSSVNRAGGSWVERFFKLLDSHKEYRVLAESREMPAWLKERGDYTIWQRNNLWVLSHALTSGARQVTVIALWNGEGGDGPGGTRDMVEIARQRGAKIVHLNTKELFELG